LEFSNCKKKTSDHIITMNHHEETEGYAAAEGELVISAANRVLRYNATSQSGDYGILCVTNFRIVFVGAESTELPSISPRQDSEGRVIPLSSVCKLYGTVKDSSSSGSVFSGRAKVPLGPNMKSSNLAHIEIACKDFHVHRFGVLFADRNSIKKLIQTLTYHCFPDKQQILFAFDFRPSLQNGASTMVNLRESRARDLNSELERCGVGSGKDWKIQQNLQFQFCESYPALIAIPTVVTDEMFFEAKKGWQSGRCPIWCWSDPKPRKFKPFLARSAKLLGDPEELNELHMRFVRWSQLPTITVDATAYTAAKVQGCYEKLLDICYFERTSSEQEKFVEKEAWMVQFEETRWPRQIISAMSISVSAVTQMLANRNILVEGHSPSHSESLVVSLIELMMDPFYRTLQGFQLLVEKEWVAAGFRFLDSHITQSGVKGQNSIFLLFLDCVHQLLLQFPLSFEFTEVFLVHLWNSVTSCLYGDFIFNSDKERSTPVFSKTNSFWAHSKSFGAEDRTEDLHINVAYRENKGAVVPEVAGFMLRPWIACYFPILTSELRAQQITARRKISSKIEIRNKLIEKQQQLKAQLQARS